MHENSIWIFCRNLTSSNLCSELTVSKRKFAFVKYPVTYSAGRAKPIFFPFTLHSPSLKRIRSPNRTNLYYVANMRFTLLLETSDLYSYYFSRFCGRYLGGAVLIIPKGMKINYVSLYLHSFDPLLSLCHKVSDFSIAPNPMSLNVKLS